MALHHFYWRGKERSVSITRYRNVYKLLFIDPEIIDEVGSDMSLEITGGVWKTKSAEKRENAPDDLLKSFITLFSNDTVTI